MFAYRLKALRDAHEMSQQRLAVLLHYSQQSVAKWENGTSLPSADVITKIAEIFQVSIDYLLGRDLVVQESGAPYLTSHDLVLHLITHPSITSLLGYDSTVLNEQQLNQFAEDVLAMVLIASKRFEPQQ